MPDNNLTGEVTLPSWVVQGEIIHEGTYDVGLTGEISLKMWVVEGSLVVSNSLRGDVTLPKWGVEGEIKETHPIYGDVALLRWIVEGVISQNVTPTIQITGNVRLPMWKVFGREQHGYKIYSLTGPVRSGGSQILIFVGPPNRVVQWTITTGSGELIPYTDITDENGMASCMYHAGESQGELVITVTYGG